MNVLIVYPGQIPAVLYGGTERVIWSLGFELNAMGHKVTFLVGAPSHCPFAKIIHIDRSRSWNEQIPADTDIIHFNFEPQEEISKPYVVTMHGNVGDDRVFDLNTIFVSSNHASRYGSSSFVYNGLNWDEYDKPDFSLERRHFHFLGAAAWRVKNVKGAIRVAAKAGQTLAVLGGHRLNFRMGFRLTLDPRVKFFGMVGGKQKNKLLNASKGLVFPVRWHEPFGLAVIESLFFGCPVFATPYGSLPELVPTEVGVLSADSAVLASALNNAGDYNAMSCHEYARDKFNSRAMALSYLGNYESVLNGRQLNSRKPQCVEIQKEKFLPFE